MDNNSLEILFFVTHKSYGNILIRIEFCGYDRGQGSVSANGSFNLQIKINRLRQKRLRSITNFTLKVVKSLEGPRQGYVGKWIADTTVVVNRRTETSLPTTGFS